MDDNLNLTNDQLEKKIAFYKFNKTKLKIIIRDAYKIFIDLISSIFEKVSIDGLNNLLKKLERDTNNTLIDIDEFKAILKKSFKKKKKKIIKIFNVYEDVTNTKVLRKIVSIKIFIKFIERKLMNIKSELKDLKDILNFRNLSDEEKDRYFFFLGYDERYFYEPDILDSGDKHYNNDIDEYNDPLSALRVRMPRRGNRSELLPEEVHDSEWSEW